MYDQMKLTYVINIGELYPGTTHYYGNYHICVRHPCPLKSLEESLLEINRVDEEY